MPKDAPETEAEIIQRLTARLTVLQAGYRETPFPSADQRSDRLMRLHHGVLAYKDRLIEAVDADFGGRAAAETLLAEIFPVFESMRFNRHRIRRWIKPRRRRMPPGMFGARAELHYQPLGVVGIVVPWNFPVFLCLSPLISVLAAGNSAMIKTSEFAPRTGAVLQEMIEGAFTTAEVSLVSGGIDIARAFTKLPFDHMVFTGSTDIGRTVMRQAAETLTPVTLELGGKSPAIIHDSFPIEEAARRLAFGKGFNAGQVCIAPDYVLVPKGKVEPFTKAFQNAFVTLYPTTARNDDYTAIISEQQLARLKAALDDAKQLGATVLAINPAGETFDGTGKLAMHLVTGATDDMVLMRQEIFGPVLPIVAYDTLQQAIDFVNARPRPLTLYYFDWDRARATKMLASTHSGGAGINDTMTHAAADDMPFGGIGASGMGHYHGYEGFLAFSHAKAVVRKGRFDAASLVRAPWGSRFFKAYVAIQNWRFRYRR